MHVDFKKSLCRPAELRVKGHHIVDREFFAISLDICQISFFKIASHDQICPKGQIRIWQMGRSQG